MEPIDASGPQDLSALDLDLLRRAVEIYLGPAYPDGKVPEAVTRRLDWDPDADALTLLGKAPFERATRAGGGGPTIFALRLGNYRYPHMKMQVQPWPTTAGFMLSVNTHDQVFAVDPTSPDAEAFRSLQAENQRIKEAIEQAWDAEGLPVFLRYLREYIQTHPDGVGLPPD